MESTLGSNNHLSCDRPTFHCTALDNVNTYFTKVAKQVCKKFDFHCHVCLKSRQTSMQIMPIKRQRGCIIVVINQGVETTFFTEICLKSKKAKAVLCFLYTAFCFSFDRRNTITREPQHSGQFIHEFHQQLQGSLFFTQIEVYMKQA